MNKQRIEIQGRVVAPPELQHSKGDKSYAKIRVACNWKTTDTKGKEKDEVTFYELLVFNKRAEKSTNLGKGTLIRSVGDLELKPYLSKDGEAKITPTVFVREFQVLDTEIFK